MRSLAAQEAPFPPEPEINDKNSVTLLLRLPDGHRHERRFLKSDKLQVKFKYAQLDCKNFVYVFLFLIL